MHHIVPDKDVERSVKPILNVKPVLMLAHAESRIVLKVAV